ncbi:MAG: peptide ABC transporter substrate-binding protein [Angelakisella sp.]
MRKNLAIVLAAAMLLSGCTGGKPAKLELPIQKQALNIQLGGDPETLDPAFAQSPEEQSYLCHLFEGLTRLGDHLEVEPGVATSWERTDSESGLITYTFTLDPAAKWSDGKPVQATDFIYAWKRILNPATQSPLAYQLYPIRGAKAVHEGKTPMTGASSASASPASTATESAAEKAKPEDTAPAADPLGLSVTEDGKLVLELEGECYDLLERLATVPWMPLRSDVVEKSPKWYYDTLNYLSNGPYIPSKWERDQRLTLIANETYHRRDSLTVDRLNFILSTDEQVLLAALTDGSLQLATTLPLTALEAQPQNVITNTVLGSYTLVFNTQKAPYSDPKVRKALSLAIDRTALDGVLRDGSLPARGLVPPGAVVDQVDLRKKSGDLLPTGGELTTAAALLKDAGYEGGKNFPTIDFVINDEQAHQRMAAAVAEAWSKLGLTVNIVTESWDNYLARRDAGKFDVTRLSVFSDTLYPSVFFDSWTSKNPLNFANYSSNDYDNLIEQSYGRPPKPDPAESSSSNPPDGKAEDKKTDDKKPVAASGSSDSAASGSSADSVAAPPAEILRPADYLAKAEQLLVSEDAVVVPLRWYTLQHMAAAGLSDYRVYPTGYLYFGEAKYAPPEPASGK